MPEGAYAGKPKATTVDGHTSAVERFTDGDGLHSVPWSEDMALRLAGARDGTEAREARVARIRDAIDEGRLPEGAVRALIRAGWDELND